MDLNNVQFQYHVNNDKKKHELTAFFAGRPDMELGRMDWHTEAGHNPHNPEHKWDAGEVSWLRTEKEFRRKGVATAMFNHAKELDPSVKHSTTRTNSGDKFAKSTGDPVPPLKNRIQFRD